MRFPRRSTPSTRFPIAAAIARLDRPQEKGAREPHVLEHRTLDVPAETLDVDDDVGKLGHGGGYPRPSSLPRSRPVTRVPSRAVALAASSAARASAASRTTVMSSR